MLCELYLSTPCATCYDNESDDGGRDDETRTDDTKGARPTIKRRATIARAVTVVPKMAISGRSRKRNSTNSWRTTVANT